MAPSLISQIEPMVHQSLQSLTKQVSLFDGGSLFGDDLPTPKGLIEFHVQFELELQSQPNSQRTANFKKPQDAMMFLQLLSQNTPHLSCELLKQWKELQSNNSNQKKITNDAFSLDSKSSGQQKTKSRNKKTIHRQKSQERSGKKIPLYRRNSTRKESDDQYDQIIEENQNLKEIIAKKSQKVRALKNQNTELESTKFSLDTEISELKNFIFKNKQNWQQILSENSELKNKISHLTKDCKKYATQTE